MEPGLRRYVVLRDGGCVARFVNSPFYNTRWPMLQGLPDPGPCRSKWGDRLTPERVELMEADHVKDELGMAIREDDPAQLWTVCPGHHRGQRGGSVWATQEVVRVAARIYIAAANEAARLRAWPPLEERYWQTTTA